MSEFQPIGTNYRTRTNQRPTVVETYALSKILGLTLKTKPVKEKSTQSEMGDVRTRWNTIENYANTPFPGLSAAYPYLDKTSNRALQIRP